MHDVHVYMDRRGVILVFQSQADEYGRFVVVIAVHAINEIAASLYHSLVDELLEGLFLATYAVIEKEFVPEAGINQVTRGVLCASHIEIHLLPISVYFGSHKSLVVLGIHIAQVVSATARETRHGVQFKREDSLLVYQ